MAELLLKGPADCGMDRYLWTTQLIADLILREFGVAYHHDHVGRLLGAFRELGLPVIERSIDRTELYTCDELLLCGTGAQVAPVIEVDRRPVGDGKVGEFTQELQNIYFGAVRGNTPKYKDWTIPVY